MADFAWGTGGGTPQIAAAMKRLEGILKSESRPSQFKNSTGQQLRYDWSPQYLGALRAPESWGGDAPSLDRRTFFEEDNKHTIQTVAGAYQASIGINFSYRKTGNDAASQTVFVFGDRTKTFWVDGNGFEVTIDTAAAPYTVTVWKHVAGVRTALGSFTIAEDPRTDYVDVAALVWTLSDPMKFMVSVNGVYLTFTVAGLAMPSGGYLGLFQPTRSSGTEHLFKPGGLSVSALNALSESVLNIGASKVGVAGDYTFITNLLESGGKEIRRLLAKVLPADADSLDSVVDGTTYARPLGSQLTSGKVYRTDLVDTRNDNQAPSFYQRGITVEFKDRSVVGAPGSATFGHLETSKPWGDSTGGYATQTFRSSDGAFKREGPSGGTSVSDWGSWRYIHEATSQRINRDSGHLTSDMQESGGKTVARLLAKALAGDADSLDGTPDGTTYKRITGVSGGQATNSSLSLTKTVVFLVSGVSWNVPANFNPFLNSVELIGGGGGGKDGTANTNGGGGGAGGGYARIVNFDPAGLSTIAYAIGAAGAANGGNGGDTTWNGGTAVAKGGPGATSSSGATRDTANVGAEVRNGSNGGNGRSGTGNSGGGGGGGAGGRHTGANNGSAASGSSGGAGGAGGQPNGGAGGTAGGAAGGAGGDGTSWDGTHGSGGGGGGGTGDGTPSHLAAGAGGQYGGAGGGGGADAVNGGASAAGKQGIIVITYYAIANS